MSSLPVAAIGSSSVEPGSPLVRELSALLAVPVDARGVRGSRVAAWAGELVHGLAVLDVAGGVIVLLGGNDAAPPSVEHVLAIERTLRHLGAPRVAWLPPPRYLAGSVAFGRDASMRAALDAARVRYVRREVRLPAREWARDRVHPTRAGYARWARTVAPELRSLLFSGAGALVPVAALAVAAGVAFLA